MSSRNSIRWRHSPTMSFQVPIYGSFETVDSGRFVPRLLTTNSAFNHCVCVQSGSNSGSRSCVLLVGASAFSSPQPANQQWSNHEVTDTTDALFLVLLATKCCASSKNVGNRPKNWYLLRLLPIKPQTSVQGAPRVSIFRERSQSR